MFIVVGERINTSRKKVLEAVENRDESYIRNDVKKQEAAGATYIDVNAGTQIGKEKEDLGWLIDIVQDEVNIPLCIDSPEPEVLMMAYEKVNRKPMINSITLEKKRYEPMMSFLEGKDCKVIALCMSDEGMPKCSGDVTKRAKELVEGLEGIGLNRDDIYIDPLVEPIGTDIKKGLMAMESVKTISQENPGIHFMCGLSNVSFGLPERKIINRHFLTLMMSAGIDGAILDPLDEKIMATIKTTEMLLGKDNYCTNFIKAVREGKISY